MVLEGVVGVRGVPEGAAADAQTQVGVPADEGGERAVVVLGGERPEQVGVGPLVSSAHAADTNRRYVKLLPTA